ARRAYSRPSTAPAPTSPPYEWTITTICRPSSARRWSTEWTWAMSLCRPLVGGSAPTDVKVTASVSSPRWAMSPRMASKASGRCQAPGTNTKTGLLVSAIAAQIFCNNNTMERNWSRNRKENRFSTCKEELLEMPTK
ncbi:hypothetical protein T310_9789, partial [Rasamsonia emersonii CBS 393.64]